MLDQVNTVPDEVTEVAASAAGTVQHPVVWNEAAVLYEEVVVPLQTLCTWNW